MLRGVLRECVYAPLDAIQRMRLRGKQSRAAEHQALAWGYRRRPSRRVIDVDGDLRMWFEQVDHIPLLLYYLGSFESYCIHFADRIVRSAPPGQIVLDVGGNIGFHALQFAARTEAVGAVLTIEASPDHAATIGRNLDLNRGKLAPVEIINMAVGAEEGELTLSLPPGGNLGCYGANVAGGEEVFSVPMTTIDGLMKTRNVDRLTLVKMDIEGSEMSALEGATETIARARPSVMIELNDEALARCGSSSRAIVDFFQARDYSGFLMSVDDGGRPRLQRLTAADHRATEEALFVPREKAGAIETLLTEPA